MSFITTTSQKEINELKHLTIQKQINCLSQHISYLQEEIKTTSISKQLEETQMKQKIANCLAKFTNEICSDLPNAFWERKKHTVALPYEPDFTDKDIPTKARPIQMNHELVEYCKQEIKTLLEKKLIRPSKSPWSCSTFYVNKAAELERGTPRLVINYKPLNKALQWIKYPIPNKRDLLK